MAVFNVIDCGAMGDGSTDDTVAIRAAIASAAAASFGNSVYLPEGIFIVSGDKTNPSRGPVELLSGVNLDGAGIGKT